MVKAVEFLDFICNNLEYRFFTGTPCSEFKCLYDNMNPKFMHYIPAVDEKSAANIVSGASMVGIKSIMILPANKVFNLFGLLNFFIFDFNIPFIILSPGTQKQVNLFNKVGVYSKVIDDEYDKCLKFVSNKSIKSKRPCAVIIDEGSLI
jgi:hypothetical protein